MSEYPPEWVAATMRAIGAIQADRGVNLASDRERAAAILILDHLVPVITGDSRDPETGSTIQRRPYTFSSNEGSVPGADMGGTVKDSAYLEINLLLEQLVDECDRTIERDQRIERIEFAGMLGELLENARKARA